MKTFCDKCGSHYEIEDCDQGGEFACPNCGEHFLARAVGSAAPAAPAAPAVPVAPEKKKIVIKRRGTFRDPNRKTDKADSGGLVSVSWILGILGILTSLFVTNVIGLPLSIAGLITAGCCNNGPIGLNVLGILIGLILPICHALKVFSS